MADQIQRNQQTPDTTIAIQKRVNRFKLIMGNGNTNQVRHGNRRLFDKTLETDFYFFFLYNLPAIND